MKPFAIEFIIDSYFSWKYLIFNEIDRKIYSENNSLNIIKFN